MSDGQITIEKHGHVLMMGLNRPDKYNAFSLQYVATTRRSLSSIRR